MAGLMLSLPTVMCCYATQAKKALVCLHAWLHDTRRGRLAEEMGEREREKKEEDGRIEHRGRK